MTGPLPPGKREFYADPFDYAQLPSIGAIDGANLSKSPSTPQGLRETDSAQPVTLLGRRPISMQEQAGAMKDIHACTIVIKRLAATLGRALEARRAN